MPPTTLARRLTMHTLANALREATPHAPTHRVLAFDRPPFGLTQRPRVTVGRDGPPSEDDDPNVYTPQGAAELGRRLLQTLGVERAIVVGHSAGAGVAMEMASRSVDGAPTKYCFATFRLFALHTFFLPILTRLPCCAHTRQHTHTYLFTMYIFHTPIHTLYTGTLNSYKASS